MEYGLTYFQYSLYKDIIGVIQESSSSKLYFQ